MHACMYIYYLYEELYIILYSPLHPCFCGVTGGYYFPYTDRKRKKTLRSSQDSNLGLVSNLRLDISICTAWVSIPKHFVLHPANWVSADTLHACAICWNPTGADRNHFSFQRKAIQSVCRPKANCERIFICRVIWWRKKTLRSSQDSNLGLLNSSQMLLPTEPLELWQQVVDSVPYSTGICIMLFARVFILHPLWRNLGQNSKQHFDDCNGPKRWTFNSPDFDGIQLCSVTCK